MWVKTIYNKMNTEEIKQIIKNLVKVQNMTSNKGNIIKNQFIISGNDWELFQSYNSPIALKKDGKVYLFENWNYSKTTTKYRNDFLRESTKETLKKIQNKEYILVDLKGC